MQTIHYLLDNNTWQNLLEAVAAAAAAMALLVMLRWLACSYLSKLGDRKKTQLDDIVAKALATTHWVVLAIAALYVGGNQLDLTVTADRLLSNALMIALTVQAGIWVSKVMVGWLRLRAEESAGSDTIVTHLALVDFMVRLLVWVVVVLSVLSNLGFNITAMVTSLGIGGVAVALAVQNILGDLFASMSIALDKPFVAGDSIVVDTISGTVKHVGLKSTRVQADSGEEVVFSNADLLKSRIRNYKRMDERRALFGFSLSYTTPTEMLGRIPAMVEEIVRDQPETRFDRAHFKTLGRTAWTSKWCTLC
ncbi:mechanosensitive ion channel [Chitinimonas arctica]|uniref:Mechanosensitive ion channel n=1 Tax=Chitinimonas arctica TaxID=2594795 RepID=A0A516SDD4_9NEIS|nr:mechanosensitive ion channel domain-containing protein [Chitinimonas arctica]QDQ26175.1 mechanosensitive ion channel [Chitinimonas arctica]